MPSKSDMAISKKFVSELLHANLKRFCVSRVQDFCDQLGNFKIVLDLGFRIKAMGQFKGFDQRSLIHT